MHVSVYDLETPERTSKVLQARRPRSVENEVGVDWEVGPEMIVWNLRSISSVPVLHSGEHRHLDDEEKGGKEKLPK